MDDILTTLDFVSNGMQFPPVSNIKRLKEYQKRLDQYDRTYAKHRKLVVRTPDGDKTYDWKVISANWFKLVTDKFIGLLLNEKPIVTVKDAELSRKLNDMIDNSDFWSTFRKVAMSYSQLGDGVFNIYTGRKGAGVGFVNPAYWYKVVSQEDVNTVTAHVLVHPIYIPRVKNGSLEYECKHIRFIAHYRGYYSEIVYLYNGVKLVKPVEFDLDGVVIPATGRTVSTGLSDFAIQSVHNSQPMTSVYGLSDYDSIEDFVYEFEKRLTLQSAVVDKHSEPTMVADEDLFVPDEMTGQVRFKGVGGILGVRREGVKPEYITWDGKTEASELIMDRMEDLIITMSELGKMVLTGEYSGNSSGEALKTSMKGALDKVSRQIDSMHYTVRNVLCLMMEIEGYNLSVSDISVLWQDGITASDKEIAETVKIRLESGSISVKGALMQYYGLSAEQADEIVKQIIEEPAKEEE